MMRADKTTSKPDDTRYRNPCRIFTCMLTYVVIVLMYVVRTC